MLTFRKVDNAPDPAMCCYRHTIVCCGFRKLTHHLRVKLLIIKGASEALGAGDQCCGTVSYVYDLAARL